MSRIVLKLEPPINPDYSDRHLTTKTSLSRLHNMRKVQSIVISKKCLLDDYQPVVSSFNLGVVSGSRVGVYRQDKKVKSYEE